MALSCRGASALQTAPSLRHPSIKLGIPFKGFRASEFGLQGLGLLKGLLVGCTGFRVWLVVSNHLVSSWEVPIPNMAILFASKADTLLVLKNRL